MSYFANKLGIYIYIYIIYVCVCLLYVGLCVCACACDNQYALITQGCYGDSEDGEI